MLPILSLVLLSASAAVPAPQELKLENAAVKLVLTSDPAWRIASLRFPGADFQASPAEPIPLYQLEWHENGSLETLNSSQARLLDARRRRDTLALRFSHDKQKLEVECRVWTAPEGLRWDASFRNGSLSGKPAIFRYPGIAVPSSAGRLDAALSVADGIRFRDVFAKMGEGDSREWDYPGLLSAQMTAWYGKTGGMALYTADSAGFYKRFRVIRYHNHIIPTFEHILVGYAGPAFTLPYSTVSAPFKGGWEAAADVYREWAIRQPWCRTRLKERRLPAAIANPAFILCSHIRLQTGNRVSDESSGIPKLGEAYRTALGIPIINLFFSWEKHGPWVAPDYFPPYPNRESFEALSKSIHARGDKTMVFLSGLNVTLEKTSRGGAPDYRLPDSLRQALEPSAIVGRDLRVFTQGSAKEGVGKKWTLCPTTAAARKQVLEGVQKSLDLGVDVIQVDQVVGGGVPPCFQVAHGHPWTGLNKLTHGMASILREAHEKTFAKGAALSIEEPGEYFIPYLDIVHTRDYMEGWWPREGKGDEGIPLFSYLYHDYLLGYGGDAQLLNGAENTGMAIYSQAIALVAGRYPAGALWMQRPDYAGVNPELKQVLVEIAAIWRSEAKDYLMFGQARRLPQAFQEHSISYDVRGHRFRFDAPYFLSMSYRLGGKEIGLFINSTGTEQPLDLRSLAGSRNLEAIWPANLAGKPLDVSKPIPVARRQILIVRRSL